MALIKQKNNADFIVREANGYRSREGGDIEVAATVILAGSIVAKVGELYVPYNPAGTDGSEDVAGVLYETVGEPFEGAGFEEGDVVRRTFIVRDAELNGHQLVYGTGVQATVDAALAAIGLIVRR